MRRFCSYLIAALALAALIACNGTSGSKRSTPTVAPDVPAAILIARGQPIKIGVSAPLSGDQLNLGRDIADAAELASADRGIVRGHDVSIVRSDDGCTDAEKTVAAARAFVSARDVAGVVGPMCTTGAQAADSVYEAAHIVHILSSATRVELSAQGEQYLFRTAWRDDAQAREQARYAVESLGAGSAVVIDDNEPYGQGLADDFVAEFERRNGRVLSRERIPIGATDFATLARQIMSASPDAVVFEGLDPEGASIARALHEMAYAGKFIGPDGLLSTRDFIGQGGASVEGAIVTGGRVPSDAFVEKFRAKFQRAPATPFVLQAYDAVSALLAAISSVAIQDANGNLVIDRAGLAAQLRKETTNGLTGTINFDENGDRKGDTPGQLGLAIYRVSGGAFLLVQ